MSRRGAEAQGYYDCVMSIISLGPRPLPTCFLKLFSSYAPLRLRASYSLFTCPCDYG